MGARCMEVSKGMKRVVAYACRGALWMEENKKKYRPPPFLRPPIPTPPPLNLSIDFMPPLLSHTHLR